MVYAITTLWVKSPSRLAFALKTSISVSTEALLAQAQVLKTFIDVNTLTLLWIKPEAMRTCAKEGTRKVSASSRRLAQGGTTFVLILTISPITCELKAFLADTGDSAYGVFATSISAEANHGGTLVNVPTLPNRSQLKARMAGASMASRQVEAGAVATEAWTPATFVHVYALISCWGKSESFLAHTLETSCNVRASPIPADSRTCCALI